MEVLEEGRELLQITDDEFHDDIVVYFHSLDRSGKNHY